MQRAASPVQHALLRSCCSRLSGRHGYSRGSQQPCAVRCVQKEAAARIEAEIEPARDAFEKQMKKGKKDKDKKRAQHDLQKAERLAREKCAKTPVCLRRPS